MGRRDKTQVTALLDDMPSFSVQNRGGIFLVIKGPDRGESVRLADGKPVYFGSSPSCEMPLSDKTVSRKHLMAELVGDTVVMRDNGSTNGTFIQGSRFKEINIGFGAEIKLGRTIIKYLPDEEVIELLRREVALLQRCAPAPDSLAQSATTSPPWPSVDTR